MTDVGAIADVGAMDDVGAMKSAATRDVGSRELALYHGILHANAGYKRFNERWVADPQFRAQVVDDPAPTLQRHRISCSPEQIGPLINPKASGDSVATQAMWQIVATKSRWMQRFYQLDNVPSDPRMRAWRERQIARQMLDLGPFPTRSNLHASLTIELTEGCSVGCWFCALSPQRLSGAFRYDDDNRRHWRGVLDVLADRLGPGARTGFLYWATDPLDNPDYERWCLDFHDIIGVFPPTTTALALRQPDRTRALLELSSRHGCWLNRFSILTTRMLDKVHAEFSEAELAEVECLPLNRESAFAFGNAGRFRERLKTDPGLIEAQRRKLRWAPWFTGDRAYDGTEDYPLGSIGCVTGWLINMVRGRVQLISPCTADDRWPLGYLIFGEAHFDDAATLAVAIDGLTRRHMAPSPRDDRILRFGEFLTYHADADGFELRGRFNSRAAFRGDPAWRPIGDAIAVAGSRPAELVARVASATGLPEPAIRNRLDQILHAGVLHELD